MVPSPVRLPRVYHLLACGPMVPGPPVAPMGRTPLPMRPPDEEVLAGVDDDETLDLLQRLVRTPSGNPPGGEARVAELLADFLRTRGFEPRLHEIEAGRANLTAVFDTGSPGPTLMLNGHLDTMPAGPGWTTDPLGGVVRDGHVFALGAADQK